MRIGVDVRPFLSRETGVGTYLKNLLFQLARIDGANEYCLFSSSWKERFPVEKVPPFAKSRFRDLRIPVRAVNFLWYRLGRPSLDSFFGTKLDLTHSPTPLALPTGGKKIVTVYDPFFLDHPRKADKQARDVFSKKAGESLENADGILTISEFTRRAVLERFSLDEARIKVTPLGLNPLFFEDVPAEVLETTRRKHALPERFLLFVGAVEFRKNLVTLVEALAKVHEAGEKVALVVAGRKGEDSANLNEVVARLRLGDWVKRLGYLPDSEVRDLYRLARIFVFPSLCEGFGLPLLEAMACGLAAAVSRAGALPEVGGEAAAYFDPIDPDKIAGVLLGLLRDADKRRELAEKGKRRSVLFRWEATARETLAFYEKVAGAR
jgi:glycosyltransferase involved in cell wall biosynthesis